MTEQDGQQDKKPNNLMPGNSEGWDIVNKQFILRGFLSRVKEMHSLR